MSNVPGTGEGRLADEPIFRLCRGHCQDQAQPIETMPGSYHSLSESKVAPMLVTGSYMAWLKKIMSEYLKAGRLSKIHFSPYLTPEGLFVIHLAFSY
jgi:hypothetical protein